MLLAYNLLFSHLFSLLLFFSFIQDLNEFYEYLTIKCDHWNNCKEGKLQLKRIIANYKLRKFVFESLWLSGRTLEREIRRSEVRFLMGTQNFFLSHARDELITHLSLFLSRAQNLPSPLFYLQKKLCLFDCLLIWLEIYPTTLLEY